MIIVTGATSGIGWATSEALADRGLTVGAVGRRSLLLEKLAKGRSGIVAISADVTSSDGINTIINAAAGHDVTGIVHAAGSQIAPLGYQALRPSELVADMAVHVVAPIELNNRILSRSPTPSKPRRIVYLDSYSASEIRVGWSGYSIVKAAAQMAARSAAAELTNAQVIRIFPGAVRTPLVEAVLNNAEASPTKEAFEQMAASGRLAEPAQTASFVVNLLLDATVAQLSTRDSWEYSNPQDHLF